MAKTQELATLPSLDAATMKELVEFNQLLDKQPNSKWVKTNKFSQNAKYLPIRVVESLLRSIFGLYQVEMIGQPTLIGNSVVVSVHLKVWHPVIREWLVYAGTGAVPIELKADRKDPEGNVIEEGARNAIDFERLNAKALHKNVPAAKSFAVSNAAKSLGRFFGSHLNTQDDLQVMNPYNTDNDE